MTRPIFLIWLLLLAISALVMITPMVAADYDMWWHIKYGEHFVQNKTWLIDHSQFSWVPAAADWPYVTWIGSSLIYLLFNLVTLQGIYILPFGGLLIILALFLLHLRRQDVPFDELSIAAFFLSAISFFDQIVRPTIFSNILFAFCLFIYFSSRYSRSGKTYYYLLPFVFLIWVNTHGSFVIGLAFLTLACCLDGFSGFLKSHTNAKDKANNRGLAIAIFFSCLVLVINPYGFKYLFSIIDHLFFATNNQGPTIISEYLSIWQWLNPEREALRPMQAGWTAIAMMASLLLFSAYCYLKNRINPINIIGLNIFFFLFGMSLIRALVFFCLVWLFSFVQLISLTKGSIPLKKIRILAIALIIFFSLNTYYLMLSYSPMLSWFGPAIYDEYPVTEVDYLLEHKLPQPVLNDYLSGGYLIWAAYPDYKVFIDSRGGPYINSSYWYSFVVEDAKSPKDVRAVLDRYPAKTIFINQGQTKTLDTLLSLPEWQLVYFGKTAVIFVHTSENALITKLRSSTDLGPGRFAVVNNPITLIRLFNIYSKLKQPVSMKAIMEIYKHNVRSVYLTKESDIKSMSLLIDMQRDSSQNHGHRNNLKNNMMRSD